ncbi:11859_t:CDS:2, partial [Rhizophagus irregularis]
QNKRAKNTLPGNSNLFEWTWPGEGSMAGYILGREIPNKKKIEIPEPTSSTHTTPKNEWVIAMPNISGIDPKRLTRERLLFELKKRNINVINTAKRDGLVKELELGLANETEMIQDDISENQENQNIIWNSTYEFPLESGWAFKSKQKYGKKGGGKRDVDKSKRFTATNMLENLRNKVEER